MDTRANPIPTRGTSHPTAQLPLLLTVRQVAAWIGARRGRSPSRSTIYTAVSEGVRGHRLASTLVNGVLHVAESDLAAFCEARDWPARSRPGEAAVEKFLKNQLLLPFDWAEPCGAAAE